MKDDLSFKQNEMEKSEATASGLAGGRQKYNDCYPTNCHLVLVIMYFNGSKQQWSCCYFRCCHFDSSVLLSLLYIKVCR